MRLNRKWLVLFLAVAAPAASAVQAAQKDFNVKYRLAIVQDGNLIHEIRHQYYGFRMEIVDDSEGVKPEMAKSGYPFVAAAKGERYSVRIFNPLPVQVAVNLTVDGLNSITGKPSGISDGAKWMIDPYSSITIPGWQVSGGEARRFFFTNKPKSYAKWRGNQLGEDLAANCGVIGAAFFWSQGELNQYYDEHPIYRWARKPVPYSSFGAKAKKEMAKDYAGAPAAAAPNSNMMDKTDSQQAGTGMGESESHPTYQVDFHYDTGMYSLSQALVIYYDFAGAKNPNPFPDLSYAPEMP